MLPSKLNQVPHVNQSVVLNSHAISPYGSPMNAASEKPEMLGHERNFTSTLFPSLKPGVEPGKSIQEGRSLFNSSKKNTENLVLGASLGDSSHKNIQVAKSKGQRRNMSSLLGTTAGASKQPPAQRVNDD